jgi:hypothetical protein
VDERQKYSGVIGREKDCSAREPLAGEARFSEKKVSNLTL